MSLTAEQLRAGLDLMFAATEVIRSKKEIPNGELYASMMGVLSIHSYETMIQTLKNAKLIEEKNHLLRWIGPTIPR